MQPQERLTPDGKEAAPRLVRWGYPLLGALLAALYARTVAPGPTFSDGPEIVTGIVTLGVIHPTGYPLFTLVAHAFVKLLPLDVQPCVKVSLFNALCAAAASIFTAHVARAMALLIEPGPHGERRGRPGADIAGLFAGALLGTSPLVWDQVRIPEVYPFHLFLAAWALHGLIRFEVTRKAGWLVMSGLAIGLGLAHHVTMVYMLPAAVIYALVREPALLYGPFIWPVVKVGRLVARPFKRGFWPGARIERAWVFPLVLLVGFLPAFFYAYLLWADKHTTGINWGGVKDWDGLYFHMTGKQYAKFMQWKDIGTYLQRLIRIPDVFDRQFLLSGAVLFFPGVYAAFKRAWRPALLLALITLFFFGHGVYYSVGDYQSYFLPAAMALSVFVGAGLDVILRFAARRAPERRLYAALLSGALVFGAASLSVLYYWIAPKRLPAGVARIAVPAFVVPLGAVALALGVAAYLVRRREKRGLSFYRLSPGERFLPAFLLASAVIPIAPAVWARVDEIDDRQVIGESYGREIMETAPPGSLIMVQGDGFLFSLWYQTHVMSRGTDSAVVDVATLGAQWYKRYLTSHYPAPCDPLSAELINNPAAYAARCKTFRQRMDLNAQSAWITLGDRRLRGVTPGERQKGIAILKEWIGRSTGRIPRLPRADVRCEEAEFRRGHAHDCRCFYDPRRDPIYSEDCVFSADEGGVVPREHIELWLQHLIEEHIDERPVFERNLFTHWNNNAKENFRGWQGPDYQRVSGDYALVNRGRDNQIVYATEASAPEADACAPSRSMIPVRRRGPGGPHDGRPYRPNEWPTLITASYLTRGAAEGDDAATRTFSAGDEIRLRVDWFEKNRYDYFAPDHKGSPIKHGIRVCLFDGAGQRVAMKTTTSGKKDAVALKLPAEAPAGDYHIAACSVGEIGDSQKLAEEMSCQRLILEYPFSVVANGK